MGIREKFGIVQPTEPVWIKVPAWSELDVSDMVSQAEAQNLGPVVTINLMSSDGNLVLGIASLSGGGEVLTEPEATKPTPVT